MKKIKQVLNEALGVQEASDWGSPEEILQDVAQTLERDVEWPLTEIMPGPEVKQLLSPVYQAINRKMDQVSRGESVQNEDISRLRQLSGLKVDEGLGYGEEQMLNKLLQEIEISVTRAEGLLNRYAKKVSEMSSYMDEEDQMHYGYGVQAMVDLISDMHARVQKLG